MRTNHFFTRALCLSSWLFAAISFLAVPSARAAYTMFVTQVGPNVVATGSGSLDTTNLSPGSLGSGPRFVLSGRAILLLGPTSNQTKLDYANVSGPGSFGTANIATSSNSGSGAEVGINGNDGILDVPQGYVSGTDLGISTDTWNNKTLSSLSLIPGIYTWTWGTAPHADSLALQITVPEPASLSLLAIAGLAMLRRRVRPLNH